MEKVFLKTYGAFLVGRTEGAEAFAALERNMRGMPDDAIFFLIFQMLVYLHHHGVMSFLQRR